MKGDFQMLSEKIMRNISSIFKAFLFLYVAGETRGKTDKHEGKRGNISFPVESLEDFIHSENYCI